MFVGKLTVAFLDLGKTVTVASEVIKRAMAMRLKKDFISRLLVILRITLGEYSNTTTERALSSKTKLKRRSKLSGELV
jgi:hypothetical protein